MYFRNFYKYFWIILCFSPFHNSAQAQLSEKQILQIIAEHDLQTAQERLEKVAKRYPASPEILFLQTILVENGQEAFKLYSDIYFKNKASRYAPDALFKIAQYNYAKGDYERARIFFLYVVTDYPNSGNRPLCQYFAARMLLAQSKLDAAESELKAVIKKSKDVDVIILADEDLKYIETLRNATKREKKETHVARPNAPQIIFAVQIGAFSNYSNAASQRQYYGKLGYKSEIVPYKTRTGSLYRVILGRFDSEKSARDFGNKIKKLHKINYRLAKLTTD
ncbi:MAG: hypothetical protein DWQ05_10500 [Calditrichaeota bacterium]|nr:MAG: hypothetical protein DWQ05_10500 [Calditrichota bacterium]